MKKKSKVSNANLLFEELEPRLLLSADGLAVITESSVVTTHELVLGNNEANTLLVQIHTEQSPAVVQAKHQSSELVIIDSRAPNFQQLHNDIIHAQQQGRNIQVVVLDAHRDGIEQISQALTTYNNLDAVHIVSHGESGQLQLGATQLDKQALKHRSDEIKQWQKAFVDAGDLLLYGCNLAGTADGQSLVNELAKQTQADVAASDDLTGNSILGGDWDLEYKTGEIESSLAFSDDVQDNWQGTLASPVAYNDSYSVDQDQILIVNSLTNNASVIDLAAAWQFDEGAGTTITDTTGSGNDGAINGATWSPSSRTGEAALAFDGLGDYVQTTDSTLDLQSATDFTLSAWFKTDTITGQHHILWQGISTENGWGDPGGTAITSSEMHLTVGHWSSPDNISFFLGWDEADPNSIDIISTNTFTDTSDWHHAVVVVSDLDGGTTLQADLYIDGVFEGSDTGTQIDRSYWDTDLRIGSAGAAGRNFDGMIDEVGIYDRALTPTEVVDLYQTGVILNDSDIDGDILSASLVTGPANGALTFNSNGSFTYTPNTGFNGTDTFTYKVNDGVLDSNIATVSIDVINYPAVVADDTYSVVEDQTLLVNALNTGTTVNDLAAAWQLEEGTGIATTDATGNSNDGTISGATWTAASRTGDNALLFDGVDDYVNLGSDVTIDNIFAGGGTLSAWIRPAGWGENGYGRILDKASSEMASDGWSLQLNGATGAIRFEHGFSTQRGAWEAKSTVTLDSWQHVVIEYDNSSTANVPLIYVNGVLQTVVQDASGGTPTGTASSDADHDLMMGNFSGGATRTFDGIIDEVGIYNRALTPAEISALFATGITANDTDIEGDTLTANVVTPTSHGSLYLNTDGSFTYIPDADFSGTDSFTYRVNDGTSNSNIATVNITVTPVNDVPILDLDYDNSSGPTGLDYDTTFIEAGGAISIVDSDFLLIDAEDSIDSITVTLTNNPVNAANKEILAATDPNSTGLSINYDGNNVLTISGTASVSDYQSVLTTLTYNNIVNNPDTTPRVITFVINDGSVDSLLATTTVSVQQTTKPPTNTMPGALTLDEDSTLAITGLSVRDNDNNLTSVSLTVNSGSLNVTVMGGVTISSGANGSNTLTLSGGTETEFNDILATLVYQGDLNFNGADSLTMLSTDALGGVDSDSVSITIMPVDDAPVAADDPGEYGADIAALNPLSYWRFGEAGGSTVSDGGSTGVSASLSGATLGQPGAINGDVDTAAGFDGLDDYGVIAHDSSYELDDGNIQLWFNADVVNKQQGLISKDSSDFDDGGHFTVRIMADGSVQARLQSTTASYYVQSAPGSVNALDWHHVAVNFGSGGMELFLDGVSVDTNAYTGGLGATSGGTGNKEPIAIGGSTVNSDDNSVFIVPETEPRDLFQGLIDEVAIVGQALTVEQIQTLYATALQNYEMVEDSSLVVSAAEGVLINDSDIEGGALIAVLDTGPSNAASFTLNADGSFNYTPVANFSGTDTFTYTANDGNSNSNLATVTITITGDNDAPVNTVPGTPVTVLEDTQTVITGISISDSDAGASIVSTELSVTDGVLDVILSGSATISAGSNSSNSLTISGNVTDINATLTSLMYTGNSNVNGIAADTLTIVTSDLGNTGTGGAQSDTDNIQIDITAVNDAPVARDDRIGLVFDGVDDYVRIGDYPGLIVSANLTMEAWIKPTGLGTGTQIIINKEGEYELGITADTGEIKWAFDNIDPDWNWYNTGYFVQAGEWTHLAVTYNNGVVNTYADGVLVDSFNGTGLIGDTYTLMNELQIGGRENAITQRFDGSIDEVRIWNTTRSQLEIQNNMSDLLTGTESGLIGNWRFDEGSGTTVADQSLLGHHGILANGVTAGEMPSWQGYVVSEDNTLNVSALNGVLPNDYDLDGDALTAVLVSGPTNAATFTLNPDGSFSYTPNTNFNGIDSFTYMANDGNDDSNVATVTIRVDPANDAPVAVNDTTALDGTEGSTSGILNATLLANDSDLDGDAISITAIDGTSLIGGVQSISVTNGTVNIDATNNITFTAAADYNGPVSFSYTISDGLLTDIATVSGTITPLNDTPTIESTIPDQVLLEDFSSHTIDLNAAFADVETADNALVYSITGNTNINVSIASGVATITPTANWNGNETLTFTATDEGGLSISQDVDFTVNPVNDAPTVANAIADVTVAEDAAPTIIDLSTVFADVDIATNADSLSYSAVSSDGTLVAASVSGTTLTLTYAANQNGTATVTVTATDNNGPLAVADPFTVTVNPVNDTPTIESTIPDQVLAEDFASYTIDLNTAFADAETIDANFTYSVSGNTNINVSIANGIATITPTANWNGNETLTFTATDEGGLSISQDVDFTVNPVNDAPTVANAIADVTVAEDAAPTVIDLSTVFADVDIATNADSLSYSAVSSDGTLVTASVSGSTLTLTYAANQNGAATITVTATDTNGPLAVADPFTVTVDPVNDAPTVASAIADVTVAEDAAPTVIDMSSVFADVDIDTNADSLSYSAVSSDGTLVTASVSGSTLTLTYAANQNGTATVTVTATDTNGPLAVANPFTVTVNPVNDTPTIESTIPDQVLAEDFTSYTIDLNTAFADAETIDANFTYSVSGNTDINVSIANGIATITPTANWNGSETLTFTATDEGGLSISQDVNFTVNPVNDAPTVANAIADVTVAEDAAPTVIDLSSVFADVDIATNADSLSYSAVSSDGTLVTASVSGSTLTLTYAAGQSGSATVTVTATDNNGPLAVVDPFTVTVTPVNDTPTIESTIPDQVLAEDFASYTIELTTAFADIETADAALVYDVTGNTNINVSIASGIATITPTANWNGSETLTFSATDAGGLSASQVVDFTVNPVNDAPTVANAIADVTVAEDAAPTIIDLSSVFADVDIATNADSLSYSAVSSDGTLVAASVSGTTLTLTYAANQNGAATIAVTATDTNGPLAVADPFTVTVNPVNDAPTVANAIADVTVAEDAAPTVIDLSSVFADVDIATNADSLSYSAVSSDGTLVTASVSGTTLTLTYATGQSGSATVTVTATDTNGPLAVADPFTVTVTPVNDAPTIESTIPDQVLAEDFASYTIDLNTAFADVETADNALIYNVSGNTNINVSIASGIATITPTVNWNGSETLTFSATDAGGLSASQVVDFTVIPVNDAPTVANAIADVTVAEDAAPTVIDLSNVFADVDRATNADSLSYSAVSSDGTLVTASVSGTTLTLTYAAGQSGSATVTVTATDTNGPLAVADPFTVTVTPVNDAPTIESTIPDQVLAEDFASYTIDLNTAFADVETADNALVYSVSGNTNINVSIASGIATITPTANWNGSETLTFSATDAGGLSASQVVGFTVNPVNDAPIAINDMPVAIDEGATAIIDLAANDTDVENALDLNSIVITGAPANGSLTLNGNGTVTYTHNGSETISDSFSYTIADLSGAISNTATVNITINPVNDSPDAQDDAQAVNEGGTVNIDLAANDTDVDSILDLSSITITGNPVNGVLTVNANGTVDYTHDGSQTLTDSFSYTIEDISGAVSNVATVNISVNPVNNAPTSNGIADITVTEDSAAISINLNDAFDDVDNLDSELTYSIVGNTSIGLFTTTAINPTTGVLVLDYAVDMNGSSQISIRATDLSGASVDTLFTVTVTPVNDTPVLAANTGMSASGTSGNVITNAELNVNDVDNSDTAIVYTITALPTSGVLMLDGVPLTINGIFTEDDVVNNRLSYQADATSTTDQFAFIVSDGDGGAITVNTFEIIVQFALPSPEPEPETIVPDVPPVITGSPAEDDPESTLDVAEVESEDSRDIDGLYVGGSFRSIPQPGLTLEPVQPIALDQPTQNDLGGVVKAVEQSSIYDEVNLVTASTIADIQVKSIKALWVAIDDMKQQIDENLTEDITQVQIKLGAISGSGVALTAGIVAWVLRSGALMTSLISTIPLWKGYDPLPILAYRDDDEEKDNLTEDKIPTSLEELKKIKELREKMKKYNQVDDLFGGSEIKG